MKKLLLAFLLLCGVAHAQTYNAIATAYVTTTISQNVVFNSTMQQGGTFTFSVLAHNGGGRPGQSDTANVKIQFYTASNTLVSTVNSSYSNNLPNPNAVCGNPCIDSAVPWSVLSTSATLSSAQAATVAYARVSMYGVDGSYWAGDYGPWYRAPTFQLNGGSNLTYNPEFGPYNNITAQGWTSSPGFGACQGAWGGSNACIVNSDGVPGTSTVGLVANQNGGGPSATGGTTSGQAGGYNSTMSTTNAGAGTGLAPPAPPPPNPTNIYSTSTTTVRIVNIWPTSYNSPAGEGASNAFDNNPYTKYLNFDKYNAGVTVKLSEGRVVSGFTITTANDFVGRDPTSYKLYGSNDGVNWTLIQEGTLSLSDSRYTTSAVTSVTNSKAYFYYYMQFPQTKAGDGCGQDCNSMQIAEITYIYDTTNTTTSTDMSGGAATPTDPVQAVSAPTVVSTSTSNSTSTSSVTGSTTTTTNQYPYVVTSTSTPTTITTTTTPVTTTVWSDGSTTTSNGSSTSTSTTTINYTVTGPINPPTSPYTLNNKNGVYITQVNAGSNNKVTADQSGHGNYSSVTLGGSNNNINVGQGYTFDTIGIASESLTPSNYNVLGLSVSGNTNTTTNTQIGLSNSAIIGVTGSNNTATVNQTGNNNQAYGLINGNGNTSTIIQTGNSNLAAVNLTGDNNNASLSQTGNNHGTVLNLINAGGPNTATVVQTGNGDAYSLQQTCTTPSGCSITIIRNK